MIRILVFLAALFALVPTNAHAQTPTIVYCNSGNPAPNTWVPCNSTYALPVTASVSISGFTAASTGTPISVTTGGVTGTLPAGAVVVATNVGATNGAYCALGASATTSSQYLSPGGGWFSFTVGSATQLTCITSTSTTTVNMTGGSGLATGTGGGGGGGGSGGAVTIASGAVASGAYASGSIAPGAIVDLGSQPDTACATDNGSCSVVALIKRTNQNLTTLNTTAGSSIPAGNNLIGQVNLNIAAAVNSATNGIYTNLLQGNAVLSATNGTYVNLLVGNAAVATGTGAQGATVPRMTVATDQATNAGAALVKGGVGVVSGGSFYQAVAASQTATVLQSSTGATGDYLSHCTIYPTSTTPGVVTVFDNTNTAANSAILFPGGASSVSNLVPFTVPVGAVSKNGAWEVTTGANVSVVCYGKFS